MIFQVKKVRRGFRGQRWMYQLVGGNGEIMMTSELLTHRTHCYEAIARIKYEASQAPVKEVYK